MYQPYNFYNEATRGAFGAYNGYQQNRSLLYSFDGMNWIFAGIFPENQMQQARNAIQNANFGRVVWFQERQS
jgi:hypothetical protein